jgi:hypothetical protein
VAAAGSTSSTSAGMALFRPMLREVAKTLLVVGAVALVLGALLLVAERIPWLGRLPGDIVVRRGPVTVYFPLLTCVLLSIILTILLNLWRR